MHTILDCITGMGFVGIEPGVLYRLAPVTQGIETTLSGTGTVALEDVVGDWVGLSLCGRSEQATTTGAQLFDASQIKNGFVSGATEGEKLSFSNNATYPDAQYAKIDVRGVSVISYDFLESINAARSGNFRVRYFGEDGIATKAGGVATEKIESVEIDTDTVEIYILALQGFSSLAANKGLLNAGPELLPWEPYTGGRPSPSPDHPQEIKSCGIWTDPYGYKIETTLYNAGYLERGSDFYNVKKIALKKGRKYRLFSKKAGNSKNAFVFSDGNFTTSSGSGLYSHGYNDLGFKTINNTGVVSEPCRLALSWNPAVEFTVTEESLYLYFAVNTTNENTDDVWVWTGEGYLTDTPYQSQTITSYLPDGLPGIPVSSGGNYTDETGQQWISDEVDFEHGKRVQRTACHAFDGTENWKQDGETDEQGYSYYYYQVGLISERAKGICSHARWINKSELSNWEDGFYVNAGNGSFEVRTDMTLDEWKSYLAGLAKNGNPVIIVTARANPIENDLSAEEIEAYKALRTYKPTTIITADGGEVAPGITATYKKGE